MKDRLFIVTGGCGFLGNNIVNALTKQGERVVVFDRTERIIFTDPLVTFFSGDIRDLTALEKAFVTPCPEIIVIHTAAIVSITKETKGLVRDVNVNGTKNVIACCLKFKRKVKKLVYVCSVHAIPVIKDGITAEITDFDPDKVKGIYPKSKAESAALVRDAAVNDGLDAVILCPSGIFGPNDRSNTHINNLISLFLSGKLKAVIPGGYDFVDVRDVTKGVIAATEKGRNGECYILPGRYYTIKDFTDELARITNKPRIKFTAPMWVAKLIAPAAETHYRRKKLCPMLTRYSIQTLQDKIEFSSEKARKELNYSARGLTESLKDTVEYIKANI